MDKPRKDHLREKAKMLLRDKGSKADLNTYNRSLEELVEELQIYQFELEHQNDELSRVQSKLDDTVNRYNDLYMNAPVGYVTFFDDGTINEVNNTFCNLVNKSKSALLQKPITIVLHPDSQDAFYFHLKEVVNSGKRATCQVMLLDSQKMQREAKIVSTLDSSENKGKRIIRAAFIDITNEKHYERLLKDEKEIWTKTFYSLSEGIAILNTNLTIVQMNPALKCFSESENKHINGSHIHEILHTGKPEDCTICQQLSQYKAFKEESYSAKLNKHLSISADPVVIENQTRYMVLTVIDISDIKQAEINLIQTNKELRKEKERAEINDRLKSSFLANMSHEIRTPLNGILGFTKLLAETEDTDTVERERYASIITKSSEGLLRIINDILDISRIDSGDLKIIKKPFDLNDMLADVYTEYSTRAIEMEKRVEINLKEPDIQVMVVSDESRLRQILSNLLDNALKFTSRGKIEFGISRISKNKIELFVSDTGIGIEPDKLEFIFDRFRQAGDDISKLYGGTGLGLTIVKHLLQLLEGDITVDSNLGEGTTFSFFIPNTEKIDGAFNNSKKFETQEKPEKKSHILLVEDDPVSRMFIEEVVRKNGYRITSVELGQDGLELARNNHFKAILMDVRLPDSNGLEIVRQIRQFNSEVYIMAQTAYAMPDDRQKAFDAGCNEFLSKPVNAQVLLQKLGGL
ncbi:MAG: ATP-binding protein [Bacteroidota bacterium]